MLELQTNRLKLMPLCAHQLETAIQDFRQLEEEMGLCFTSIQLDDDMEYAIKVRLRNVRNNPELYVWLTSWAVILKEERHIIGFFIVKGYPNEQGEVIVGYGIEPPHRGRGYAGEALLALADWMFQHPDVSCVIADTEKTNTSSHRVLQKAGAVLYKETRNLLWWKLEKQ